MPRFINYVYFVSDIGNLNIKSADNCCIVSGNTKSKTINLIQNISLTEKSKIL